MQDNKDDKFLTSEINNLSSNFEDIAINFEKIEEISKKNESSLEQFFKSSESEVIKLMSYVYDVNQIYLNPSYISKIVENKIKKILNLDGFFLYFIKEKKQQENRKEKESEISGLNKDENFIKSQTKKEDKYGRNDKKKKGKGVDEVKKVKEEEKKEEEGEEKKKVEENNIKKGNINENNNNNNINQKEKNCISENDKKTKEINDKSEIKKAISFGEINASESSLEQKTSLIKINAEKDLLTQRIVPELYLDNEEILDGKDYESRAKSYFKLFLECCTEKDLKIESNPGRSIKFVYKYYEKLISEDNSKINKIIKGNSKNSSEVAEFDFMIKNVNKSIILNILNNFKGNIICNSDLNSLDENKNYQIIGEIAKNILKQSSDKINQINKYVDIILINDLLKKLENVSNKDQIEMNFNTLNFNFYDDKIIMIITDGSYIQLLKVTDINEVNGESKDNNSLFNRDIKDIQNYNKIIQLLKNSKIPFIIFFMPNDLRNNIDDYLIEHAKKINYRDMKTKYEKNVYNSYSIKLIEEEIKKFKIYIMEYILSICNDLTKSLQIISSGLYAEIIESIKLKNIFKVEFVIYKLKYFEINNFQMKSLLEKKCFYIEKIFLKNDNEIHEYKKVPDDTFRVLICEETDTNNFKFLVDNDESFSIIVDEKDFKIKAHEIISKLKEKFQKYFAVQIKKKIQKNCLYYSKNEEYLNAKNLIDKIKYDLAKLNLRIICKKETKRLIDDKVYNNILNYIKKLDIVEPIKSEYDTAFTEETKEILNLKDRHFINLNKNKVNVFDQFCCWKIYEMFFDLVAENPLDPIILSNND